MDSIRLDGWRRCMDSVVEMIYKTLDLMGGVRCMDSIRLDGWSEMYGFY